MSPQGPLWTHAPMGLVTGLQSAWSRSIRRLPRRCRCRWRRRDRFQPFRNFFGDIDLLVMPEDRTVSREHGPQALLLGDLPDDWEEPVEERPFRLILHFLDGGIRVLREPLKIDSRSIKLALKLR